MKKPIYTEYASYGHMGREDLQAAWEKKDRVEAIRKGLITSHGAKV